MNCDSPEQEPITRSVQLSHIPVTAFYRRPCEQFWNQPTLSSSVSMLALPLWYLSFHFHGQQPPGPSIVHCQQGFYLPDDWNSLQNLLPPLPSHSIDDVLVRGILLCGVTSQRRRLEMRLFFKLGTSPSCSLNSDFVSLTPCARIVIFFNFNQFRYPWLAQTLYWF